MFGTDLSFCSRVEGDEGVDAETVRLSRVLRVNDSNLTDAVPIRVALNVPPMLFDFSASTAGQFVALGLGISV